MKITRRDFLKTTALTSLYFAGFGGQGFANSGRKKNLVIIMLRGGMDGLQTVGSNTVAPVPFVDPRSHPLPRLPL